MKRNIFLTALITAMCLIAPLALADVPGLVNYQGYLTDSNGDPLTDFMDMEFTIWDDAVSTDPGNLKWTETWTGAAKVLVEDGYYSALLGTYESFCAVFAENDDLWLQVQVGVETLSPRKRIASAAYAQRSPDLRQITFMHWGKNTCPAPATLVYSGYAASSYYNESGSGADTICLTDTPIWTGATYDDGSQPGASVYGARFDTNSSGASELKPNHGYNVACSVCSVDNAADKLMIPGTNECPAGWTQQYWGYLMSTFYAHAKGTFFCVDHEPTMTEIIASGSTTYFNPAEAKLGTLQAPYVHNRELTCTVCTR